MIWTQWVNIPENLDKFKICSNTCARLKMGHDISITLSLSLSIAIPCKTVCLRGGRKNTFNTQWVFGGSHCFMKDNFFTNVIPYQEYHLKDPVLGIY